MQTGLDLITHLVEILNGVAIDTGSSVARPAKNCLLTPAGGINHHENAAATEDPNSLINVNLAHPL